MHPIGTRLRYTNIFIIPHSGGAFLYIGFIFDEKQEEP